MKISVITINYNNLEGLRRTVPSVLSQTYNEYEYVVVDGGSTDGSKEYIASQDRIDHWVSEPDKGIYNAMNKAVRMAHGDYCIFMNSGDTFFSPLSLEQCVDHLGEYDLVAGRSAYLEPTRLYPFIPPKELSLDYLLIHALCHQSLFTKTSLLKQHPFNENNKIVSDLEQYFRGWLLHGYSYKSIDIYISVFYRDGISYTNKSVNRNEKSRMIADIIDNYNKTTDHKLTNNDIKRIKQERKFRDKIDKAFSKKSPLKRDLNIIKYGFRFLFKDLFASNK